ncbi:hypothetical protein [Gallaecimonas xiamenensis]|uniref:Flagellar protein FliT n=1 Tax=Gallaecimonas xiamenensis 3-C-1 TaxID=745411 RepID=K2JYM1_9GAMM|nr:hypothetical protein [Gallaecimonas xiamenensis]EKE75439.1 hypothetical protein B3C1_07174 [Gallaecimonas xiamenensis 3-C-1]
MSGFEARYQAVLAAHQEVLASQSEAEGDALVAALSTRQQALETLLAGGIAGEEARFEALARQILADDSRSLVAVLDEKERLAKARLHQSKASSAVSSYHSIAKQKG